MSLYKNITAMIGFEKESPNIQQAPGVQCRGLGV